MNSPGKRVVEPGFLHRLVFKATTHHVTAFVVPGADVLRARGIDLDVATLSIAATPRHASLLVVVSPLPDELARAAATVYAQIPAPRAVIQIGRDPVDHLAEPDIILDADATDESILRGVQQIKQVLIDQSYSLGHRTNGDHTDANAGHDAHRSMEEDGQSSGHDHQHGHHVDHANHHMDHSEHQAEHDEHSGHQMDHSEHDGHGGHDMHMGHGSGFMSMIAMTKDLPRSDDGLQMDWVETPFGPLFPGLPGGLNLTLTLDGDTVAKAKVDSGAAARGITGELPVPGAQFVERMAHLDLLAPGVYRLLARRGRGASGDIMNDARELEIARAASHLGWLASFAALLGYAWLADEAAALQITLVRYQDPPSIIDRARRLLRRTQRTWLLRHRLEGLAQLSDEHIPHITGPVARASGVSVDARRDDPVYRAAELVPVLDHGGDAWARLNVRLNEIVQSLDLARRFETLDVSAMSDDASETTGASKIETPRGTAHLRLAIDCNEVTLADLTTPSRAHLWLVPLVAEGLELGDALAAIASLDLSPWEIDQ